VSGAREEVLARVRAAIRPALAPEAFARRYGRAGARDPGARIDLLAERIADYRAEVHRVTPAELPRTLATLCPGRTGVPPGLPVEWRPPNAVEDEGLSPTDLDRLDGVLTGCAVAIAETGTLVLAGGAAEGRRALTLVPDRHVCVVRAEQVVETVPEAFDVLRGLERRPLTFVSGPSATSDIELERVEGVHGPRTLVVVIVAGLLA
jgi:L-lactate dehydrogenase complex protein LldG